MVADNINHNGACLQMNTGEQAFSRPSLGSWLIYGLGSENQNLPGFVVISPAQPAQGAPLWGSSFLPAAYQGTLVADLKDPDRQPRTRGQLERQRQQLDALPRLNELHREQPRGRQPAQRPHRVVRAGLPDAGAKRRKRSTSTARRRPRSGSTASTTRRPRSSARSA